MILVSWDDDMQMYKIPVLRGLFVIKLDTVHVILELLLFCT